MPLPATHLDLLDRPLPTVLTTHMPDGRLQTTVVWSQRDGDHVLINTMREFQKGRNLRSRPRATILVVEPGDANRWIEVRARVVADARDALAHLDALGREYTGVGPYFGRIVPAEFAETEHPVLFRLIPTAVCTGPMRVSPRRRPVNDADGRPADCVPADAAHPSTAIPADPAVDRPTIPKTHRDLLERPLAVALSTRMPDGSAQTHPVWCSVDGDDVLVNTTAQRRKGLNLAADPRATVLAVDPADSSRWIEIRGDVELVFDGALEHLDRLTAEYTGHPHYYGKIYPVEQRQHEDRVIVRIRPSRILCDAIHR